MPHSPLASPRRCAALAAIALNIAACASSPSDGTEADQALKVTVRAQPYQPPVDWHYSFERLVSLRAWADALAQHMQHEKPDWYTAGILYDWLTDRLPLTDYTSRPRDFFEGQKWVQAKIQRHSLWYEVLIAKDAPTLMQLATAAERDVLDYMQAQLLDLQADQRMSASDLPALLSTLSAVATHLRAALIEPASSEVAAAAVDGLASHPLLQQVVPIRLTEDPRTRQDALEHAATRASALAEALAAWPGRYTQRGTASTVLALPFDDWWWKLTDVTARQWIDVLKALAAEQAN